MERGKSELSDFSDSAEDEYLKKEKSKLTDVGESYSPSTDEFHEIKNKKDKSLNNDRREQKRKSNDIIFLFSIIINFYEFIISYKES
jgi:hypothetical protein